VINKLVRAMTMTPLKVYLRDDDGDHVEQKPITNQSELKASKTTSAGAQLANLLNRPAPRRGAAHFKQWVALATLVFGNSLIAKYRETPELPPTELIPMDYRFCTAYAQRGGDVELWRTDQLGRPRWINAEEVIHTHWFGIGSLGISPMEPLVTAVNLEDAARRWLLAAFRNAARPSSAITLPPNANPTREQMTVMRETVEAMHKGVDNAFKVAMLAPGATWQSLGFNMQEAELMAVREFSREEFCMVYDVKPGQVGAMTTPGSGYSSVVEINRDLYRSTLPPWFTLIEDTIQTQLIDPEPLWEGLEVEFDTKGFLKGEPEQVAAQIATEIGTGTMTPNEGRDLQSRPRDDDPAADQLYMPANNLRPIGEPGAGGAAAPPLPPAQVAERITLTAPAPPADIPNPADTTQPGTTSTTKAVPPKTPPPKKG
jgi:HK97 family phage portal protein